MENSFWTSDRRFKRLELLVHCFLLVSCVKSQTAHDLRPRNVSITFGNDFCLTATWDPPEGIDGVEGCEREDLEYKYCTIPKSEEVLRGETVSETIHPMIEGGTLGFSVQTSCSGEPRGEPVVVNITTNPKLVHDLQCVLYSSTDANCSWTPSSYSHVPDLRLFYWMDEDPRVEAPNCDPLNLKECVISPHPDNVTMSVCHISENLLYNSRVYFLFNGTQDNMSVRNTFNMRMFANDKAKFRLPALNWTLVRDGDNLIISWTPPEILTPRWKYLINYTQCNEKKNKTIEEDSSVTLKLPFDPRCQYRIKLKAIISDGTDGETPWSDEKVHGENVSPDNSMITTALIALLLATTTLCLAFCAVRKYKEQLLPRIPEPKDFLKEMLDNNNKCPAEKLYVPVEDTEDTRICLVLEPGVTKLDAVNP